MKRLAILLALATFLLNLAFVGDDWAKTGKASGDNDLFIYPGFEFKVVDHLITNFHLPKSTLLMLVSAFAGYDLIMSLYRHAIAKRYRFFSYGDAMLLDRAA